MRTARQFLAGNAPAARFPEIGAIVTGIVDGMPEIRQQRGFPDGELLFWEDGQPKEMLVVTLTTSERDPDVASDDGTRMLYVKGRQLETAVKAAVKTAGVREILPGGELTVTYVRDGEPASRGIRPPKVYGAKYVPPAIEISDGNNDPYDDLPPEPQDWEDTDG